MPGTPHPRKGRGEVPRLLSGQNRVVEKMKPNRPGQALIAIVKPAADEIANHDIIDTRIFRVKSLILGTGGNIIRDK